ncbi:hypothetical protein PK35_16850 [Tamlana nanhaiensis]|uniref:Endonuclease GajA/Old nuclease/RecF-like AAA domain-containing protein n=1 Tax=Neotamlana nanhaiensis TaxID=1382798 RepID=A0A0D7VX37_9FLAO|nr:AAA family ATPase [Tamlana nanhaiensis]KJD31008.1 hypothetical protein PK35_16850 [Tamlana nanhaiensis]
MKILYLNNFRGFKETYIPFMDMNFFVGENSTGKSSVLSLLRLISTPQFWNNDDFNTNDIELGFFNELASKNIKGIKEFQIGFRIDSENDDNERNRAFETLLITYKNEKGSPKLSEMRMLIEDVSVLLKVSNKQIRIYHKSVSYDEKDPNSFRLWVDDSNFEGIKYKIYSSDDEYGNRVSFYEIRRFLRKELPKKYKIEGLVRPNFLPYTTWIAPIRTKPKRIYESFKLIFSPEGDHTPLLIKSILANQFKKNISKDEFSRRMSFFGKQSGLFDKIEVKNLGKDLSSPFILNVYLNGMPLKLTNVGYGVGQILPLLTEILVTYKGRWFSIQQPEVHLHPKAQAAWGEFIYSAASNDDKSFLIETHSDFIIDRYRYCLKKGKSKPKSQVLFFERNKEGNKVTSICIEDDGNYAENQPTSFRDFFLNEELNLLSL